MHAHGDDTLRMRSGYGIEKGSESDGTDVWKMTVTALKMIHDVEPPEVFLPENATY